MCQRQTSLTWKPFRATNSLRMSLVPSKIRKILRSLITLSTPASCKHIMTSLTVLRKNKPHTKKHFTLCCCGPESALRSSKEDDATLSLRRCRCSVFFHHRNILSRTDVKPCLNSIADATQASKLPKYEATASASVLQSETANRKGARDRSEQLK